MSRHGSHVHTTLFEGWDTWMKVWETMIASNAVIAARGKVIGHAVRSPATADLQELWQMSIEKVRAFSEAWTTLWMGGAAYSQTVLSQCRDVQQIMSSGREINPGDMMRLANRSSHAAAEMMRSSGDALAPIHRSATANARRLRTAKSRKLAK